MGTRHAARIVLWTGPFVLALVLAAAATPAVAQARRVRPDATSRGDDQPRRAIVVGVAAYPESSELPALKYAAKDAEAVAAQLRDKGYTVTLLVDAAAGTQAVREVLQDLPPFPGRDGTVLFYFAGHGVAGETKKQLFLALHGTTLRSVFNTGLSQAEIDQLLEKTGAKRRIMWIDACRTLSMPGSRSASLPTAVELAFSQGTRVLFASEASRPSYEVDELQHGVFTHFLVTGLEGAAARADGVITLDELTRYVTHNVVEWAETKGRRQRPYVAGEHSGDFFIARVTARAMPAPAPVTPAPVAPTPSAPLAAPPAPLTAPAAADPTILEIRKMHDQERWGESVPLLDRLLSARPRSPELLSLRSHAYSHLNRNAEAIADGEQAVRVGPEVAEAYLRRGEALMGQQKYHEAIADFDRSLKYDPSEAETWGNRGASLAALGQHKQAEESYSRGVALRKDRYDFWLARGVSRFELGNRAGAISDFTEAIALRLNDPVVHRARANAYAATKELELALKDITQALRLNADDPDSLATRAYIYSELGQRDKAIEDLRYVVRLRPNMTEAVDLLKRLTADPRAGGTPAPLAPPAPDPPTTETISYARLIDTATAAIRTQRYAEAAELVDRMTRAEPARGEGWMLRGVLAITAFDNLPAAYESYEKAISLGGGAIFRLAHDHGPDQMPCFGVMTITRGDVQFSGETGGHQFSWPHATIREAGLNDFYGSLVGMFHIKTTSAGGSTTFNFAVVRPTDSQILNRRPDAEMLLGFINRRRR